jgi:phosphomevalonate kinase
VKVIAPGKLVLTGAYAVLEGAPAIVIAVDRHAVADVASPDEVDVRALHDASGRKLGLGSSAASMVATEGARAVARGEDPSDPLVRTSIFRAVRGAHAVSQGGGSGVDVAASVHGGVLRYELAGAESRAHPLDLPRGLVFEAWWSGWSARTSDLLARVAALKGRTPGALEPLVSLASMAAAHVETGDAHAFVRAARAYGRGLFALGQAADAPIVLPGFAELAAMAEREDGAFLPSGAGGGDVGVWLGVAPPSAVFAAHAASLSMSRLALALDRDGVRTQSTSS